MHGWRIACGCLVALALNRPVRADPPLRLPEGVPDLGFGFNVSNRVPRSTFWPPFRPEHAQAIRAAGFQHVRLRMEVMPHADPEPPFRIAPEFFEANDEAVRGYLAAGLKIVLCLAGERGQSSYFRVEGRRRGQAVEASNMSSRTNANAVFSLAHGVDGVVRRLGFIYDTLGRPGNLTCFDATTGRARLLARPALGETRTRPIRSEIRPCPSSWAEPGPGQDRTLVGPRSRFSPPSRNPPSRRRNRRHNIRCGPGFRRRFRQTKCPIGHLV